MIDDYIDRFRFLFLINGCTFGLTQDFELVEQARKDGCVDRSYKRLEYSRPHDSWEWEVNLGVRPEALQKVPF